MLCARVTASNKLNALSYSLRWCHASIMDEDEHERAVAIEFWLLTVLVVSAMLYGIFKGIQVLI